MSPARNGTSKSVAELCKDPAFKKVGMGRIECCLVMVGFARLF